MIGPLVAVALVAAGVTAPCPARGEGPPSGEPLAHTQGWSRVVFADGFVTGWSYSDEASMTLGPGDAVEVAWGGRCWLDGGQVQASWLFWDARCAR